ncbi:MAG: hypothetical protein R2942_02810 [Ignavibacteria bacterium]
MKTEGMLILTEATSKQKWVDLVFGLTEGWWRFEDSELRPDYALLNEIQWRELLTDSGFNETEVISVNGKKEISLTSQSIILSKNKEESDKKYLICSDDSDFGDLLKNEITASGNKAILLNSEKEFVDFLSKETDFNNQDKIIFYSNSDGDNTNEISHYTINYLLTILQSIKGAPNLTIITKNSQHVISGDTTEGYADSPLWGFGKVIAIEHPELNCKRIDLDINNQSNAKLIIDEINSSDSNSVGEIAFRNGKRFKTRLKRASSRSESNITIDSNGTI